MLRSIIVVLEKHLDHKRLLLEIIETNTGCRDIVGENSRTEMSNFRDFFAFCFFLSLYDTIEKP